MTSTAVRIGLVPHLTNVLKGDQLSAYAFLRAFEQLGVTWYQRSGRVHLAELLRFLKNRFNF
jgi:hypothetical protein